MASRYSTGSFVHVVATLNTKTGEGKILYVNPASSTIVSDAKPEPNVELAVADPAGKRLYHRNVVVRRSSCEHDRPNDVGLIQEDLPRQPNMKSVSLLFNGKEVARYQGGSDALSADAAPSFGLALAETASPNRRRLAISELAGVAPTSGVTYSVQVKPDTGGPWNTIAVGRPTPEVDLDSNQFPGAKTATVRVVKTTGFDEETIAEESVDLRAGLPA